MNQYDLEQQSCDGKEYYIIALDIQTGEYFQIKNYGCAARADNFIAELYKLNAIETAYLWKRFKTFHMGTDNTINLDKIYKKYHKYFKKQEA